MPLSKYLTAAIFLLATSALPSFAQGRAGRGGAVGATSAPVDISQSRTMDQAAIDRGADRRQLKLVVAGGAMMIVTTNPLFNISSRNLTVMRKVLWQQGCLLAGEDTGGTQPRTMTLKLDTGETLIDSQGRRLTF